MQTAESLKYEAIPYRFCENGTVNVDYAVISDSGSDDFSYPLGLDPSFSNPGNFLMRRHVNAIGRLGTSAQAVVQAGGLIGYVSGVSYGEGAALVMYDGGHVVVIMSSADGNTDAPPFYGDSVFYRILCDGDVSDGIPQGAGDWVVACRVPGSGFFDVN